MKASTGGQLWALKAVRAMLLFWGLPGLLDWWCHRRSKIEHPENGGVRESLTHLAMLVENSVPVALVLFAEPTPAVVGGLASAALAHEFTAHHDVRLATDSKREVSPGEQQIHSFLEVLPFALTLLYAVAHENSIAPRLGHDAGCWRLQNRVDPEPSALIAGVVLGAVCTGLPYVEELTRCWRGGRTAAGRRST
jgi:hypothetical protein